MSKLMRSIKVFNFLVLLLIIGIFCPIQVQASKAKVTLNGVSKNGDAVTYNFKYTANSNCDTKFKTCLTDSNGRTFAKWPDIKVSKGKSHKEPQRLNNTSKLPAKGDLFIVIKAKPANGGSEGELGSWKFAFNRSGKPAIYCTSVKRAKVNGEIVQQMKFRFEGAYPKQSKICVEIYNSKGKKLVTKKRSANKAKGNYTLNWDGYADNGGIMCKKGKYIIKYWIDNAKPKQKEVNLKF